MRSNAQIAMGYAATRTAWFEDQLVVDAVAKRVEETAEIAKYQYPLELRPAAPGVDWDGIAGMRDRLVHDYDRLNLRLLRSVVNHDLPELVRAIDGLLADAAE